MKDITFVRDEKYFRRHPEKCDGGIETRRCNHRAVWTELEGGFHVIGILCDSCKSEVETYVNNQPKPSLEQAVFVHNFNR